MMMVKSVGWISGLAGLGLAIAGCSGTDEAPGNAGGSSSGGGGASPSVAGTSSMTGGTPGSAGTGTSGSTAMGGSTGGGGAGSTGGSAAGGTSAGGSAAGGTASGGTASGGTTAGGAGAGGTGTAGASGAAGSSGSGGGGNGGPCTASKAATAKGSGSGTHTVVIETNSDPGINEGTIYRPSDLGPGKKYPIFVWGEGGCSKNGLSNQAAMAEIASHGYFVVADGTPGGSGGRAMNADDVAGMAKPLLAYVTWAIAENGKSCSAYHQSLDTTKVAANGFSCGGLMAEGTAGDPRITTWGLNSSGLFSVQEAFYKTIHTPVLLVEGGTSDTAYQNGLRDYDNISKLTFPLMFFSKNLGHGGDLGASRGGDFTKINLAWLNWWLKGDEGATGKGALVGAGCKYCSDSSWEVKSAHLP